MNQLQSKMTKWLNGFAIFFQICIIILSISLGGLGISSLAFTCNKKLFNQQLDDSKTVADIFAELDILSRWDLVAMMISLIVYFSIILYLLIMIKKWFKSTSISSDPFGMNSLKLMQKASKFAIIASIVGFVFETILSMFMANFTPASSYETVLFVGLLIKCLSYVFAYANVPKTDSLTTSEENNSIE